MVTKGLNKITQNETQDLQLVDNFCKSWEVNIDIVAFEHKKTVSLLPILWCALVDSNHRPPPCQGDALTKLS